MGSDLSRCPVMYELAGDAGQKNGEKARHSAVPRRAVPRRAVLATAA